MRSIAQKGMATLFLLSSSLPRSSAFRLTVTSSSVARSPSVQPRFTISSLQGYSKQNRRSHQTRSRSVLHNNAEGQPDQGTEQVSLYRSEGIFAVYKPLDWTSSNVVSFIRKLLERDARERGANPAKIGRKNKSRQVKVGHGGTLDPLATGVLVIGVGKGTKELQGYLSGSKGYTAEGELGFETTTLDMDITGNVTKTAAYDHITRKDIEEALPSFTGAIQQIPPIFSALKKGGKKLYERARAGETEEDIKIEPREVVVHKLDLLEKQDQRFSLDIECGGGTYVRSLIRDIGYKLDSVATMTALERTKQGQFTLEDSVPKDDWSPDTIYAAIDKCNAARQED